MWAHRAWLYLKSLKAPGHLWNLANDKDPWGNPINDRIDAVSVC